jgi:uncharacterized protein (DUF2141 family)
MQKHFFTGALIIILALCPAFNLAQADTWVMHVHTGMGVNSYAVADVDSVTFELVPPDTIPPAPVVDLAVQAVTTDAVTLTWTAPGDDWSTGTASMYDLRYSTEPISPENFDLATMAVGMPAPLPAGSSQAYVVTGLTPNTPYFFALKTADEVPNWSSLSNLVMATTGSATTGTIVGLASIVPGIPGDLTDARVALYASLNDWMNDRVLLSVRAAGSGPSVTFSLENLPPGVYYLDVWKDANGSGMFDSGDFWGCYGTSSWPNPSLTPIMVIAGEITSVSVSVVPIP